ncbi:MAG: Piwi domain-containing protein [Pseudomonadales bacterium]
MEQFAKALRDGIDDDNGRFSGGLVGKFRLTNMRFHFVEIASDTAESYANAATRALEELPQTPAMALVQVREAHKQRLSGQNPYFVAKSRFMRAGVPVQAVRMETIEQDYGRAFKLNNLGLAAYAKIGGVPWVISTRGVATHELVIGIGATEVGGSRLGDRTRYVGITTLFQGDGRYLVWETTREATFETYPQALLESLRKSIRFVQAQNKWESGDNVRLVFHVYKPLKRVEIETVKELVQEMLGDYAVEFAFLDISHHHPFQIFDPTQKGVAYRSQGTRQKALKGIYAPQRGTAMLLGPRTALLQLVGANEVKTWGQGLPRPLLLELHPDSDFSDLTYLVRQAFHFSFMSWRSFFPSHEPVTILYSHWIANLLGNLKTVPGWDGSALNLMRDRRAMWFL